MSSKSTALHERRLKIVTTYRLIAVFRNLEHLHWEMDSKKNCAWPGLHHWPFPRLIILDLGCTDRFYRSNGVSNFEALKHACEEHQLEVYEH